LNQELLLSPQQAKDVEVVIMTEKGAVPQRIPAMKERATVMALKMEESMTDI